MAKSRFIEALEEQYTKKDSKSVLRYKAPDNKWRYVQTSKDASGGSMPSGGGMTEVTWQELKDKRDNGGLTPGSLYHITDYNCTTTQENTRSAGHQFDIVLLALSEDKLAEEGWAMMNESNIYDVTFADNVTKKCYLYEVDRGYNIIDVSTLLGCIDDRIEINETNKTAILTEVDSTNLTSIDLIYNYFQNSNLSAWKVWYCLDNDKSRFAWADDSVDEDSRAFITTIKPRDGTVMTWYRYSAGDLNNLFAWKPEVENFINYTASQTPNDGDTVYRANGTAVDTVISFTPAHEGTGLPNGRGVIYRLIDEFNNDCCCDFKNIMINVPLDNDCVYDPDNGSEVYIYYIDVYDLNNGVHLDASTAGNTMLDYDDDIIRGVVNNKIEKGLHYQKQKKLPRCSIISSTNDEYSYFGCRNNTINDYCENCYITSSNNVNISRGCRNIAVSLGGNLIFDKGCNGTNNQSKISVFSSEKKHYAPSSNDQLGITRLATLEDLE